MLNPVDGKGVSFAEPKLLDSSIPDDELILEALQDFRNDLKEYQLAIGNTTEDLKRQDTLSESNVGNLVTDSMRTCYWNDTIISYEVNSNIR